VDDVEAAARERHGNNQLNPSSSTSELNNPSLPSKTPVERDATPVSFASGVGGAATESDYLWLAP
jgi:hypothetical protein